MAGVRPARLARPARAVVSCLSPLPLTGRVHPPVWAARDAFIVMPSIGAVARSGALRTRRRRLADRTMDGCVLVSVRPGVSPSRRARRGSYA